MTRVDSGFDNSDTVKRLLVVTTIARTMEGFLLPFAHHFRDLGWRVDGMAEGISSSAECIRSFDQVHEIEWSRNPLNPSNLLVAPREIVQAVKDGRYDLVHVHTPVAAFVTRCVVGLRRKSGLPRIIYTAHGFHFEAGSNSVRNLAFLSLEKIAGNWTDYLVVMNSEDEMLAQKHRLVPGDRLMYMPGIGVDTASIAPDKVSAEQVNAVRKQLAIDHDAVLFSMLAAFEPRKRHGDAIRAFASLKDTNVHLAFAGAGPLMSQMQELAAELGVSRQVHFLGHCKDLSALIRASAATLLPSAREGLSRSVMESLSLAVPVIGTNVKGIKDLLIHDCGLLVEVGDINGLARAMAWVAEHPDDARVMGEAGRRHIASYDTARIIELHDQLYARALADAKTEASPAVTGV